MNMQFLWTCPHCQTEQWGNAQFDGAMQMPYVILICQHKGTYCQPTAARVALEVKATLYTLEEVKGDFVIAENKPTYAVAPGPPVTTFSTPIVENVGLSDESGFSMVGDTFEEPSL